ncbi:MAG: glycosyltransferase family 4 protein [Bacteroidales bacterium]
MNEGRRRIVFVNQSAGYLTVENINEFSGHFDDLGLIYGTMTPNQYPLDRKVERVRVIKKTRKSNTGKVLRWLLASIQIHFYLLFRFRGYEVFYYTLPPFSYLSSLFLKRKFSVMIFDVYPDILASFGISKRNPVYRLWSLANKRLFARAHRIYTISNSLRDVLSQYVSADKITVVRPWGSLSNLKPLPKQENPFTLELGLEKKLVVQYSGNIGMTHNVELLIRLARDLQDYPMISFVIIGRGKKVELIRKLIEKYALSNCVLLPFQPEDKILYSLSNADIGVVMLDDKAGLFSIPSKVYNIMAVGSAILAIASPESDLGAIVDRYQNGVCLPSQEYEAIKDFIIEMSSNPEKLSLYMANSIRASADFTVKNAGMIVDSYLN